MVGVPRKIDLVEADEFRPHPVAITVTFPTKPSEEAVKPIVEDPCPEFIEIFCVDVDQV